MATKQSSSASEVAKAKASVAATLKRSEALVKAFGPPPAQLPAPLPSATPEPDAKSAPPVVAIPRDPTATIEQQIVGATLSPSVCAAVMVQELTDPMRSMDLTTLAWYFKDAAATAAGGDLSKLQEMLAVQARSLDQIFYNFARQAARAKGDAARDACLKIALKAQAQSRCTVESLAAIQQGPTIFAKQANVNQGGQQQVNNEAAPRVRGEKAKSTNRTIARNQEGSNHG